MIFTHTFHFSPLFSITRSKLENSMDQWQKYDSHYDNLSQWLKDSEAQVRSEAALKPDLSSKKEQYELFKVSARMGCGLSQIKNLHTYFFCIHIIYIYIYIYLFIDVL